MPHVVIKMIEGRSDAAKQKLADAVVVALNAAGDIPEYSLSVAIEDVPRADWMGTVFEPEIRGKAATLFKKPGYAEI